MKNKQQPSKEEIAKKTAQLLGMTVEEVIQHMPKSEDVNSPSNIQQKMFEAQSVINYFNSKGRGFYHRNCRVCGKRFAYSYPYPGITMCNMVCMAIHLRSLGLDWNPFKPLRDRYGPVMPGVVPPEALEALMKAQPDLEWVQEECPKASGKIKESPKPKVKYVEEPAPPVPEFSLDAFVKQCTVEPQDYKHDDLEDLDELLDL